MGIRIRAYGITENRYFAFVLGLWVLGIMIYFSLKKKLANIVIPISLSIVILLSTFGPLSGFSVSKFSQNNRLKNLLERNGMLVDGEISKKENIPREDKEEISAILMYFQSKHSLKDVRYIPEEFKIKDMEVVFGFPYTEKGISSEEYFSYYMNPEDRAVLDVKGYDYSIQSLALMNSPVEVEGLNINYKDTTIEITEDGNLIYEKNLKDYIDKLLINPVTLDKNHYQLNPETATFVDENERIRAKILITSFSGAREFNGENVINHVEFEMLVDIK